MYFGLIFIPFSIAYVAIATVAAINIFLGASILLVHIIHYNDDMYVPKMPPSLVLSTTYLFASFVAFMFYFLLVDTVFNIMLAVSILFMFFSISYVEMKGLF